MTVLEDEGFLSGLNPFPDPASMSMAQIVFMTFVYGYVLLQASNMISDGSELLLLVPNFAPIVGSVVLPILGAVPDGMMVLVSGLGPDAQTQVAVGVGALAGSTIMLLTLPWFLAVLAGRVNIKNGTPTYKRPPNAPDHWTKLDPPGNMSLLGTGVGFGKEIKKNARMMMFTLIGYVIIQGSAFDVDAAKPPTLPLSELEHRVRHEARFEHNFALLGLCLCMGEFVYYLWDQSRSMNKEGAVDDMIINANVEAIQEKRLTLRGAMASFRDRNWRRLCEHDDFEKALLDKESIQEVRRMCKILQPFFEEYDTNGDKKIDFDEFCMIFRDVNENLSKEVQKQLFEIADQDHNDNVSFQEFVACMMAYALDQKNDLKEPLGKGKRVKSVSVLVQDESLARYAPPMVSEEDGQDGQAQCEGQGGDLEEEEEEEKEDVPEDLMHLSPEEQQRRIRARAFWMMTVGTVMVILFSDPMVDLLSEIGDRLNINAFYVSFVLAPLASNSSELVASYAYAKKRTMKSMTNSLSQLEGAAIMNNTFCLGIFLALVYFRGLAWEFTAETVSIAATQLLIGLSVYFRKGQRLLDAFIILGCYPLALALVYFLESYLDWD